MKCTASTNGTQFDKENKALIHTYDCERELGHAGLHRYHMLMPANHNPNFILEFPDYKAIFHAKNDTTDKVIPQSFTAEEIQHAVEMEWEGSDTEAKRLANNILKRLTGK